MPIPTPTGICRQPSNPRLGYTADNPVGGIELPLVTCNDLEWDYKRGNVFKLYTDTDSERCPSYPRSKCPNACLDACQVQYEECRDIYARGCDLDGTVRGKQYGQKGHWNLDGDDARKLCASQYQECRNLNKGIKGDRKCLSFDRGW